MKLHTDFSLSKWKVEKSVAGALEHYQISELLEMLNLQPYMKSLPCSRQQAKYSNAGPNGWQNGNYLICMYERKKHICRCEHS